MAETSGSIRLMIVDEHPIVREALRVLIEAEPGMEVVGEVSNGAEALQQVRLLGPDVVLLNQVTPHQYGLSTIHRIRAESPQTQLIVLTSSIDDVEVVESLAKVLFNVGAGSRYTDVEYNPNVAPYIFCSFSSGLFQ